MKRPLKIRKATVKDQKRIAELFSVEYSKPPYNGKWTRERALIKVKSYYKSLYVYVGILEKEIVGFIMFKVSEGDKEKETYIQELVVGSKFQGKGFGKTFLKFIEDYSKKKGVKNLALCSNIKSKAFKIYKKLGWKQDRIFVYMTKKIK
jgi:aminoglycoside 6'-N-acetyltransferase I